MPRSLQGTSIYAFVSVSESLFTYMSPTERPEAKEVKRRKSRSRSLRTLTRTIDKDPTRPDPIRSLPIWKGPIHIDPTTAASQHSGWPWKPKTHTILWSMYGLAWFSFSISNSFSYWSDILRPLSIYVSLYRENLFQRNRKHNPTITFLRTELLLSNLYVWILLSMTFHLHVHVFLGKIEITQTIWGVFNKFPIISPDRALGKSNLPGSRLNRWNLLF